MHQPQHPVRLIRSASLSGYVELVQSLGRDPYMFMRTVGLPQSRWKIQKH